MFDNEDARAKAQNVTVGDDLYGVSVAELEIRIDVLREEITRTEAALTKNKPNCPRLKHSLSHNASKRGSRASPLTLSRESRI